MAKRGDPKIGDIIDRDGKLWRVVSVESVPGKMPKPGSNKMTEFSTRLGLAEEPRKLTEHERLLAKAQLAIDVLFSHERSVENGVGVSKFNCCGRTFPGDLDAVQASHRAACAMYRTIEKISEWKPKP